MQKTQNPDPLFLLETRKKDLSKNIWHEHRKFMRKNIINEEYEETDLENYNSSNRKNLF